MNAVALFIFLIGMLFIIIGYFSFNQKIYSKDIEYRYIPRNMLDQQYSDSTTGSVGKHFSQMFDNTCPSSWFEFRFGNCGGAKGGGKTNRNN